MGVRGVCEANLDSEGARWGNVKVGVDGGGREGDMSVKECMVDNRGHGVPLGQRGDGGGRGRVAPSTLSLEICQMDVEGSWWWEVREGVFTGVAHGEVKRVAIKKEG